jgi:hypothetical protein
MLKRVNIQYSIDLEQLPSEIDRIYANARDIFQDISLPNESGKEILTAEVLKKLDDARKKLTYLDHILSDVSGIVGSYVEYELSTLTNNQGPHSEVPQNAENTLEVP